MRIKNLLILFIISTSFFFHACDEYRNFDQLEILDFVMDDCHRELIEGRFIITSDSMYQEVMKPFKDEDANCENAILNTIDFETYSLLGSRKCGTGCETNFIKNLYFDETNEKYIFDVKVQSRGGCEPWVCSMNWTLVPALPDGYFVEFL